MSKNIISAENSVFKNCYSGTDFEDNVVEFLQHLHFKANRIRKNDGGVDIIASICIQNTDYKFFIQCKYYNRTLTKTPVQEVFTGSHYYDNAGYPVVITNNRMTYEARRYAKKLGVEVIADIEWEEIRAAYKSKIINSPYQRKGLLGMILAYFGNDQAYFQAAVSREDINYEIGDFDNEGIEELKERVEDDFDAAEECLKEAAQLQEKAAKYQLRGLRLQKNAIMASLEYG